MAKKLKVWVQTVYVHGCHEVIVDLDDDLTDDEIEDYARDVMYEQLIEWGWEIVEE